MKLFYIGFVLLKTCFTPQTMDFYWYQMICYRPGPSSTACWRVITWLLTFEVGRQHFRLYWISGQTFEWFGGLFKNLAICIKYYELSTFIVLDSIFIDKYIVKRNKRIVNHTLLGPSQLLFHIPGKTCMRRI